MNRLGKISDLYKAASKAGKKGAAGINFYHAKATLSDENPGIEFSKNQILERILKDPVFSDEDLDSILKITIEPHHAKMMSKREKAFVEIGAFLTQKESHIQEIGDYLTLEGAWAGWISERYDTSNSSKDSIIEAFNNLDQAQRDAHNEAARKAADSVLKEGRYGNGYETNEVVYSFEDGWKVVYVPAVGEGPNYKGDPSRSNDRIVEGNINGLCLGEGMGLYQDNSGGRIYSVRDADNNPEVTIRVHNGILREAKGKQNRPPEVLGAKHADEWFKSQEDKLNYKYSHDYMAFPPLTKDKAIANFNSDRLSFYKKGWIAHWFKKGIPEIDADLLQKIKEKNILVIYSGIGKKYKELAQPVVKHWAEKWNDESAGEIWANFEPNDVSELSHESWKTYKKEPWMMAAVEKLMLEKPVFGFKLGLQKIEDYRSETYHGAKKIAASKPREFYNLKLNEDYPDLENEAFLGMIKYDPIIILNSTTPEENLPLRDFYRIPRPPNYTEKYFEYEEIALKAYFQKFLDKHREIKEEQNAAEARGDLMHHSMFPLPPDHDYAEEFARHALLRVKDKSLKADIALDILSNDINLYGLNLYDIIVNNMSEEDLIKKIANPQVLLARLTMRYDVIYHLLQAISREKQLDIYEKLKDKEELLFLFYKKLNNIGLEEMFNFPKEFINNIPRISATYDPEYFQDNFLSIKNELGGNREGLEEVALKNLSQTNFARWLNDSGLKASLMQMYIEKSNVILESLVDRYLDMKHFDELKLFVDKNIEKNLEQFILAIESEKDLKEEFYNYAPGKTKEERSSELAKELVDYEDPIKGFVSGIFVWFSNDKIGPGESRVEGGIIKDQILNELENSEEFFKFYKQGYHSAVSLTNIDTDMSRYQKDYLYEAEGINSDEESFLYQEDWDGSLGSLFDRPKTQEELEEEDEALSGEVYKEREREADKAFYKEEDDSINRLSSLIVFLKKCGFTDYAERVERFSNL